MTDHAGSGGGAQRTALIHDFLVSIRGADRVFLEICALWPDADIFTPVYDERGTEGRFADPASLAGSGMLRACD